MISYLVQVAIGGIMKYDGDAHEEFELAHKEIMPL